MIAGENVVLHVDYDTGRWQRVDDIGDSEPDAWAVATARAAWAQTSATPEDADVTSTATQLLEAHEGALALGGMVYAYWPNLGHAPDPLAIVEFVETDDRGPDAVAELAGSDDPANVEPPTVVPVETPIGVAVRVSRYLDADDGAPAPGGGRTLMRVVTFAWDAAALGGCLLLTTLSTELDRMVELEPALDDLARGISYTLGG